MSLFDDQLGLAQSAVNPCQSRRPNPPRRTARFEDEPGYYEPAGLWLYGNARLVDGPLGYVSSACGPFLHSPRELDEIERQAEAIVLEGKVLVCGFHNPAHQRAAIVPLRWGSPRIIVCSGGFRHHLGPELDQEPFMAARLWRYQWDHTCDLAVSRRAPDKQPTFGLFNPTVDRLIARLANGQCAGALFDPQP